MKPQPSFKPVLTPLLFLDGILWKAIEIYLFKS